MRSTKIQRKKHCPDYINWNKVYPIARWHHCCLNFLIPANELYWYYFPGVMGATGATGASGVRHTVCRVQVDQQVWFVRVEQLDRPGWLDRLEWLDWPDRLVLWAPLEQREFKDTLGRVDLQALKVRSQLGNLKELVELYKLLWDIINWVWS